MRRSAAIAACVSILVVAPLPAAGGKAPLNPCLLVAAGSGTKANSFAFDAAVFGVQDVGGGFKIGKQAFHKPYRFAMTGEVLRSFSTSEVAGTLKGDLASAGVLGGHPTR